jgi:hypothetical protein
MDLVWYHESLKAYLAPTGLVSEPRGDLTCRGDLQRSWATCVGLDGAADRAGDSQAGM